jgi:anthranilate/para-aminobenzoate synthase component II
VQLSAAKAQQMLTQTLDRQRGLWLASSFEYRAVQFHPESILSADKDHGLRLIHNLVGLVRR